MSNVKWTFVSILISVILWWTDHRPLTTDHWPLTDGIVCQLCSWPWKTLTCRQRMNEKSEANLWETAHINLTFLSIICVFFCVSCGNHYQSWMKWKFKQILQKLVTNPGFLNRCFSVSEWTWLWIDSIKLKIKTQKLLNEFVQLICAEVKYGPGFLSYGDLVRISFNLKSVMLLDLFS